LATGRNAGQVTIQGEVTLRAGQSVSADVQVRDGTGATPRRVNGEAAGKAEMRSTRRDSCASDSTVRAFSR